MNIDESTMVTLIGALSALLAAIASYIRTIKKQKENQALKNELHIQSTILDFSAYIGEWSNIVEELQILMEETDIDRFLLLRAWNGKSDPKWATAVLQLRQGAQKPIQYIHFELDDDYVNRIRHIQRYGYLKFNVEEIPESCIKSVYEFEGVKSSLWAFIAKLIVDEDSNLVQYCSFSSFKGPIDEETETRCKILVGRLKGAAEKFAENHHQLKSLE